jgi:hypothetical protein
MLNLLKRPSGYLPLVISTGFLALFAVRMAQGSLVRQPDEDAAAHLFQLLMPLQFLIIIFFAISWLPKNTKAALQVLVLQCAAAVAVVAVIYFRHL